MTWRFRSPGRSRVVGVGGRGCGGSDSTGTGGNGAGGAPTTGRAARLQAPAAPERAVRAVQAAQELGARPTPVRPTRRDRRGRVGYARRRRRRDRHARGDTGAPADAAGDTRADAGDGAAPFAPCPADGGACVVMPLGDSIPKATDLRGRYRVELFHQANLAGKNITFVGRRATGRLGMVTGGPFRRQRRLLRYTIATAPGFTGISGQLTADASTCFTRKSSCWRSAPTTSTTTSRWPPHRRGWARSSIRSPAPPRRRCWWSRRSSPRAQTPPKRASRRTSRHPALVQARADAGKHSYGRHVHDVHRARRLQDRLLVDDLHPNPAGYTLMARPGTA